MWHAIPAWRPGARFCSHTIHNSNTVHMNLWLRMGGALLGVVCRACCAFALARGTLLPVVVVANTIHFGFDGAAGGDRCAGRA